MLDNKIQRDVKNQSYLRDDPSKVSLDSDNAVQDLVSQDENNDLSEEQYEHDFRYSIDDIERKEKRDEIRHETLYGWIWKNRSAEGHQKTLWYKCG